MGYDKQQLPTRVVAYLRASGDRQAGERYTLSVQKRAINSWAADHNIYIAGVFVDEGQVGSVAAERRGGLAEALAAAAELEQGALVVYRLDRLDPDPIMQTLVEQEVRRLGSRVYSSTDSPHQATFDFELPAPDTRYQRAVTSLRLRVGRLRKHKSGGYAYGAPPTGFRAEGGELVPDLGEQRILQRAHELHREGASLRTIAAALTAEGYSTRRSGRWQPTQVARLLQHADEQTASLETVEAPEPRRD